MRAFLAARYRPDLALCDRTFFSWYFREDGGAANIASIWDDERLVGTIGYVPNPVFWGRLDEPIEAAWIVNWVADPDYRHGIGVALLTAMQRRFPVVFGIGATNENQRIVERLGWTFFEHVPRYIAIFDPAAVARLALPEASRDGLEAARFVQWAGDGDDTRPWSPSMPAPQWERYRALAFGTIRSEAFLRWRYLEHPFFQYAVLTAGDAAAPALAVYRIEHVREVAPVARVVEFFHPDDDAGTVSGIRLARALATRFKELGCAFADCVISSATYGSTFAAAGWALEDRFHPLLPSRLQPVERVSFAFNLEYVAPHDFSKPTLEAMYVTRGNGDADRPTTILKNVPAS